MSTDIEQAITLSLIDDKWKEHLRAMDELKDSVQSASFEQKDPLVIYKMEAYKLFENLIHTINREVVSYLMRGQLMVETGEQIREAKEQKQTFPISRPIKKRKLGKSQLKMQEQEQKDQWSNK
ncbi:MAG: hypothetical protein IPL23_05490 [Saprospiraceae bacterium]|nr:hypothetical protein [Saprospiraceae bacterium]